MATATASRHRFTLVEAAVLVIVLGVLVALLLPARQAAREAARRYTMDASKGADYAPPSGSIVPAAPRSGADGPVGGEGARAATKGPARKIAYTGDVQLVVDDFPKAADAVIALVKQNEGYLADTDITGWTGAHRTATWKARIPIDRFDGFLAALVHVGELQRRQVHSQDITEEYYDLETRIKNKKVEEARLVKHLTDSPGKLEDILAVERELSRVREEVERMEGRFRLLANLADLTTVTIHVYERGGFVPETAPSFATRSSRAFVGSARNLGWFLQYAAVQAISVIPWLPLWIVAFTVGWLALRRYRRWSETLPQPVRSHTAP